MHLTPPTLVLEGEPAQNLLTNTLLLLAGEARREWELVEPGPKPAPGRLHQAGVLLHELAAECAGGLTPAGVRQRLIPFLTRWTQTPTAALIDPEQESHARPEPADEPPGTAFWRDLGRLEHDLEYLSLIEQGGIAALNQLLERWLGELRTPQISIPDSRAVAARLNDLCRRAIYLFPHLAGGVRIHLVRDDAAAETAIVGVIGRNQANRRELWALMRSGNPPAEHDDAPIRSDRQRHGEPMPAQQHSLCLPLPYFFSAQTEAGRRRARRESWEDFVFLPRRWVAPQRAGGFGPLERQRPRAEMPPLLLIRTAFDRELGLARSAFLLAREVERIEFTSASSENAESAYLRAYSAKVADRPAEGRPDPLTHYLVFRDFGDIGNNPRLARALGIPRLADTSLFEPEYSTGLCDVGDDETGRQWLERGFGYLALLGRGHADPRLLRFAGVELADLPGDSRATKHSALQCALYRAALDAGDPLRRSAREFSGDAIIRELMQVPVAARHFAEH